MRTYDDSFSGQRIYPGKVRSFFFFFFFCGSCVHGFVFLFYAGRSDRVAIGLVNAGQSRTEKWDFFIFLNNECNNTYTFFAAL